MKTCILILVLLSLSACAPAKKNERPMGTLTVEGSDFKQADAVLFKDTVESSIVLQGNSPIYLIDFGMNGNLSIAKDNSSVVTVGNDARFSYVFQHGGMNYMFFTRHYNIYLSKSADLYNWVPMNGGAPVLRQAAGTNYSLVWNVGVTVDDAGTWHLLAETSPRENNEAMLMYSTATLNGDMIDFEPNKSAVPAITFAGNPYLTYVPGKGLLAVYGAINAEGIWEIRAATMVNGVWKVSNNFYIGTKGVHVADPHLVETSEGLIMTLSFDQFDIYKLTSPMSMGELFESVVQ